MKTVGDLIDNAIVAARSVFSDRCWRHWASGWLEHYDRTAASAARALDRARYRPGLDLDELHCHYLAAIERVDWEGSIEPELWAVMARTMREQCPDLVPDERTTLAAGAEAAAHAAWAAELIAGGQGPGMSGFEFGGRAFGGKTLDERIQVAANHARGNALRMVEWVNVWVAEASARRVSQQLPHG